SCLSLLQDRYFLNHWHRQSGNHSDGDDRHANFAKVPGARRAQTESATGKTGPWEGCQSLPVEFPPPPCWWLHQQLELCRKPQQFLQLHRLRVGYPWMAVDPQPKEWRSACKSGNWVRRQ